jgi:hypothetical protein
MSLEEALARMTKAVEANTAAILGSKGAKPASTEAAAPAAEKPAPAAAEGGKRGPGRPAKAKAGPTLDEVTTAANAYMEANGKPAARALLQEHGSKSGKLADLPEGNYAAVLKAIADAEQEGDEDGEADDDGI